MHNLHLGIPPLVPSSSMATSAQQQPTRPTRRRMPKTCGECRRLKLKCDRVFPCQSCVKRGCEGICPEGSLVSGRGSRYILANTEQLHEKIVRMAERIRDLEDALKAVSEEHARCLNLEVPPSVPAHPLLREDLLLIKNQLELYGPDRSQLTSRSDVSYTSDGSDGEQSRLGRDQSLSPSQFEALILGSAAQVSEQEYAHYTGGDNINPASQMISNVPLTTTQWPANFQVSNIYQTGAQGTNGNGVPHTFYPSTANTAPVGGYQLRNYQASGSPLSLQDSTDAAVAHHRDGSRYLPSDVLARNDSELAEQWRSIWGMDGRSL